MHAEGEGEGSGKILDNFEKKKNNIDWEGRVLI